MKIDAGLFSPDIAATGALPARLEAQGVAAGWSFESARGRFILGRGAQIETAAV